MKRLVMLAMLVVTMLGVAASVAPVSADQHKDNMKFRCSREKC